LKSNGTLLFADAYDEVAGKGADDFENWVK